MFVVLISVSLFSMFHVLFVSLLCLFYFIYTSAALYKLLSGVHPEVDERPPLVPTSGQKMSCEPRVGEASRGLMVIGVHTRSPRCAPPKKNKKNTNSGRIGGSIISGSIISGRISGRCFDVLVFVDVLMC